MLSVGCHTATSHVPLKRKRKSWSVRPPHSSWKTMLGDNRDSRYLGNFTMRCHPYSRVICAHARRQSSPKRERLTTCWWPGNRIAPQHCNPAKLWWEYPTEAAQSLNSYFLSVRSRWSSNKLMFISICPSRERDTTFLEWKLGQEILMSTNKLCHYSESRDLLYLQTFLFISYLFR